MRDTEPARWDDYALAILLFLIAVPRVVIAVWEDRPLGVEGTVSIGLVVLALLIIAFRRSAP
jgi:hypothetical protein